MDVAVVLIVLLLHAAAYKAQFIQPCNLLGIYHVGNNGSRPFKEHSFTKRGQLKFFNYLPDFIVDHWRNLSLAMTSQPKSKSKLSSPPLSILEIGCGSGRTSLEFQSMFPDANIVALNKGGYGNEQAESINDLIAALQHFKIKMACDPKIGWFHFPFLQLVKHGIGKEELPHHDESFDVIISQHTLNIGKILSVEAPKLLFRIGRLLTVGEYAAIALLPLDQNLNPKRGDTLFFNQNCPPDSLFTSIEGRSILYRKDFHVVLLHTWDILASDKRFPVAKNSEGEPQTAEKVSLSSILKNNELEIKCNNLLFAIIYIIFCIVCMYIYVAFDHGNAVRAELVARDGHASMRSVGFQRSSVGSLVGMYHPQPPPRLPGLGQHGHGHCRP